MKTIQITFVLLTMLCVKSYGQQVTPKSNNQEAKKPESVSMIKASKSIATKDYMDNKSDIQMIQISTEAKPHKPTHVKCLVCGKKHKLGKCKG